MASSEQKAALEQGTQAWHKWRADHPYYDIDLTNVKIDGVTMNFGPNPSERNIFDGINLRKANLEGATLTGDIRQADFSEANLRGVSARNTRFLEGKFIGANLREAHLSGAILASCNLIGANLTQTDLTDATVAGYTIFSSNDLRTAKGLETIKFSEPPVLAITTLLLPQEVDVRDTFLKNAGVSEADREYAASLERAREKELILYQSCFISYASANEAFAKKLFSNLQKERIRAWFAPESLKGGDYFQSHIDRAVQTQDRLLLILSKESIASKWVAYETNLALEKERETGKIVLFPIKIDNEISSTEELWARRIKKSRHIEDFTGWKTDAAYNTSLNKLLDHLKPEHGK